MIEVAPITLSGRHVRLEPLTPEHCGPLWAVAAEPALWRWTLNQITTEDELRRYVRTALESEAEGHALPFAIVSPSGGEAIGSTRFGNIDREHDHVEIGWTWVGRPWQRTAVNTEAKFLLLRHAFETIGCQRVEFKTDALNAQSRAALLRIGAKEEGTFRKHLRCDSGRWRDSVYYSVLAEEWPAVKACLEQKLRPRG